MPTSVAEHFGSQFDLTSMLFLVLFVALFASSARRAFATRLDDWGFESNVSRASVACRLHHAVAAACALHAVTMVTRGLRNHPRPSDKTTPDAPP